MCQWHQEINTLQGVKKWVGPMNCFRPFFPTQYKRKKWSGHTGLGVRLGKDRETHRTMIQ